MLDRLTNDLSNSIQLIREENTKEVMSISRLIQGIFLICTTAYIPDKTITW